MWSIKIDRNAAVFWTVFMVCYLALFALMYPSGAHTVYVRVFLTCYASIFAVVLILMFYRRFFGFDILDPIYFISFIYGLMFFVTPAYDIAIGNYLWFGYDVFGAGVRATIYAMIGYIVFAAVYSFGIRRVGKQTEKRMPIPAWEELGRSNVWLILVMFLFCFVSNMYYLTRNGSSWLYVLSLGVFGAGGQAQKVAADLGFLAMFSYCLPAIVLLYWEYGKSKPVKWLMFALMLVMQVARGFRFFVIQIFITFLAYVFLRRNKRPNIWTLLGVVAVAIVPIMLMTLFRNAIRAGSVVDYASAFKKGLKDAVDEVFWFNFRIYHNYHALVAKVPSRFGFVYGQQIIIGTAVMLIPRILWPNKISSGAGEPIWVIVGNRLKGTGQALPNLGEFYYALGIAGIIICMAVYGLWMRYAKRRYLEGSSRPMDIIRFSIMLGVNLQIIIRGYTPSNFWYVIFSLLPVWIFDIVTHHALAPGKRREMLMEALNMKALSKRRKETGRRPSWQDNGDNNESKEEETEQEQLRGPGSGLEAQETR